MRSLPRALPRAAALAAAALLTATGCASSDPGTPPALDDLVTLDRDRGPVLTDIPDHVADQFAGVVDAELGPWEPLGNARMLTPCRGPMADWEWESDVRTDFAYDLRGDLTRNLTRQLSVHPDATTAAAFVDDFTTDAYVCSTVDGQHVSATQVTYDALPDTGEFDQVLVRGAHTTLGAGGAGHTKGMLDVLVRQDNAVFVYHLADDALFPTAAALEELDVAAVDDALGDARILCALDRDPARRCDAETVPHLAN